MINLYIDESGSMTHNNLEWNNYFVICIVRVYDHEKLAQSTRNFVSHHKKEIMEVDDNHIMFDDKGRFIEIKGSCLSQDLKEKFAKYLCKNYYFDLTYVVVDNSKVNKIMYENTSRAFSYFLMLSLKECIRKKIFNKHEEFNIQIDERNVKAHAKYFLEEYFSLELVYEEKISKSFKVSYHDSKDNRFIQIADLFSNLYYSNLINNDYEDLFNKMRKEGFILNEFKYPKIKR